MKNVYDKIKELRKSKGLTQSDVAEKIGLTQSNYQVFESGKTEITLSRLEKLSDIFGVSVLELLGGEDVPVLVVDNNELENLRKENEVLSKENELLRKENDLLNINNNNILLFLYKEIGIDLGLWESQNFEMDNKKNLVLKKEFANKIEEQFFEIDFVLEMFEKDLVDNIHFKEMFEEYKKRKER